METRKHPRINVNLKVISRLDESVFQKFSLTQGKSFEARVVDISILGVGIVSRFFLPRGLILLLEIEGGFLGLKEPIKVKGEVRYCVYMKSFLYRCGLKFIELDTSVEKKLREFIRKNERRKEPRLKLTEE